MQYEAKKIANMVLSLQGELKYGISNLRLNKLLYLAHGWSLTHSDVGLIRNHFEAWKHGPVVRTVYDNCKKYGDNRISVYFSHINYATGSLEKIEFNDIFDADRELISRVVRYYDSWTTFELVELTHEPGGPWDVTIQQEGMLGPRIPLELIKTHFRQKIGDRRRS